MGIFPIISCWVVRHNGDIAAVYRSRRRAVAHGGEMMRSVLVPATLWEALHRFADHWFSYRDTRHRDHLDQVTWSQVMDAEADAQMQLARHGVRVVQLAAPIESNQSATDAYLATAHERDAALELAAQLRTENRTLRKELKELERAPQDTKTAMVIDMTRTFAYINAAMNAPTDAVQAYRAGMLYAAQLLSKRRSP